MRISRSICALFLALLLPICAGACQKDEDFFDVFRGGFTAELSGSLEALSFAGLLVAEPAELSDGGTPLPFAGTFTFYAPESLSGTVLTRTADGTLSVTRGELTVPLSPESGFAALFALFPVSGDVSEVTLSAEGHTEVTGEGFSLSFLSTGEPITASTTTLSVKVIRFENKTN